jgi:hypothetical protein
MQHRFELTFERSDAETAFISDYLSPLRKERNCYGY